ncbi:pyruvate, phosphate dikinase [Staphylococcus pseudintermedius]|uniref:pyruvate, phosphate dikinase n=1 Tax=Staphylococcus pseudintermedius TaxID=283734 RepID=UPI000C7085DC|nr:pyruvate, phosphate dikinase [Staphylococcus pseudintermedius]EIK0276420.1 pyruvate, phosphate dikinase [Staphylococcus pseudintermedius]EJG1217629.1 pyruvate, phosphate dikinase [Staphylococcus pseudintermedius]EJJ6362028.1 pyruvate, phosphate dikinase [Staphylococcus pseudintermedius]EJO7061858.1 pyruvate, phosphate dikinase [Staphylococcus pseudintermedius]EJO7062757.1 pyruvate, phosphate dikinase [Staphylococcus pseudintermedius]
MTKYVYAFDEGQKNMKDLLGGKGANLSEMKRLGLPVPDGFTITTAACIEYLERGDQLSDEVKTQLQEQLEAFSGRTNKAFSSDENLLLVSVRSGAKISMPGMMDTILNLGLNDENVEKLARKTNDARFAYDCYRRLLQMFGEVVYGIPMTAFDTYFDNYKATHGYQNDADIPAEGLQEICEHFKTVYIEEVYKPFPQNPLDQLLEAIEAVFKSWDNDRARVYRDLNDIPHHIGTAVNVQEMVFGNSGPQSGTGVAFTRNPVTGEAKLFGEYLLNAQGEDVVAGIRTPQDIATLHDQMPHVHEQFVAVADQLEQHYQDMQDIEFTIENEKLYILQTRNGKRTAKAAMQIAVDLVEEGVISKKDAMTKVDVKSIDTLLHPTFEAQALEAATIISKAGLPASPGAATGKIVFSAKEAKRQAEAGEKVILMRPETSPEDIEGMIASEAIVTTHGGMTSHAAVVARGMGKCCVTGCADLEINTREKTVTYANGQLFEGDEISVDGAQGDIYAGIVETTSAEHSEAFEQFMQWTEEIARLGVRMNAETTPDIEAGYQFNAQGIGLVRTEHMFFGAERLVEMRRFILSSDDETRTQALNRIRTYQTEDFEQIFRLSGERPTIVRLLDPPLHEFLPKSDEEVDSVAKQLNISAAQLKQRIAELHETNPMLGHRGCRLAITYPELYVMQVEAMMKSVAQLKEEGITCHPEIMVPLVSTVAEFKVLKAQILDAIQQIETDTNQSLHYLVGTMIETPRACVIAGDLAKECDFFSFGTNDLTQLTFGFSRDDAGKFINDYLNQHILAADPFQTLDVDGVGELVRNASEQAKAANPNIKIGVCGELGGDPKSIHHFNRMAIDYVSCSPFRVPGAKLAAAQSVVESEG